ncbi:uncharacterized protein [Argopecten irradians]|uniref:uncharacterized protein n=1 Tax=Argopecten irradians TaxID=31199 RepID=UPI0037119D14
MEKNDGRKYWQCNRCEEWYHPECLGLSDEPSVFICHECQPKKTPTSNEEENPKQLRPNDDFTDNPSQQADEEWDRKMSIPIINLETTPPFTIEQDADINEEEEDQGVQLKRILMKTLKMLFITYMTPWLKSHRAWRRVSFMLDFCGAQEDQQEDMVYRSFLQRHTWPWRSGLDRHSSKKSKRACSVNGTPYAVLKTVSLIF